MKEIFEKQKFLRALYLLKIKNIDTKKEHLLVLLIYLVAREGLATPHGHAYADAYRRSSARLALVVEPTPRGFKSLIVTRPNYKKRVHFQHSLCFGSERGIGYAARARIC